MHIDEDFLIFILDKDCNGKKKCKDNTFAYMYVKRCIKNCTLHIRTKGYDCLTYTIYQIKLRGNLHDIIASQSPILAII